MATRGGKQRNKQHRDARRSALVVVARRSTLLPLMASGNEKNRALLLLPYSRLRTRAAEGNRNENWSSLFYRAARAQSCPDCSTLLLPLLAVMHARACLQLQAFARCCHHAPLRPVASVGVVTRRRQRAVHRGRATRGDANTRCFGGREENERGWPFRRCSSSLVVVVVARHALLGILHNTKASHLDRPQWYALVTSASSQLGCCAARLQRLL